MEKERRRSAHQEKCGQATFSEYSPPDTAILTISTHPVDDGGEVGNLCGECVVAGRVSRVKRSRAGRAMRRRSLVLLPAL